MENVNRALPSPSAARDRRWLARGRRLAAPLGRVVALVPTRAELLFPWAALRLRPALLAAALVVLVALAGIGAGLERTVRTATPVITIRSAADLGRPGRVGPGPVGPGRWGRMPEVERYSQRPGLRFDTLPEVGWAHRALGLPERQPGAPLAAYAPAVAWLRWICAGLVLAAFALLPAVVIAANTVDPQRLTTRGAWHGWRILTAPFGLAGLALIVPMWHASADGVPWWILSPPAAQWGAETGVAAAVALAVGCRLRRTLLAMLTGYALVLALGFALTPAVAFVTRWLSGWTALLPDPEVPWWVTGCLSPAIWVLLSAWTAAGLLRVTGIRAAPIVAPAVRHPDGDAPAPRLHRPGRPLSSGSRWLVRAILAAIVALAVRAAVVLIEGEAHPQLAQWNEPITRRLAGQPTAAPSGMRRAFRAFGAGDYAQAIAASRSSVDDALAADDRRLLEAASLLALGETDDVKPVLGGIRMQYSAAIIARRAAELLAAGALMQARGRALRWSLAGGTSPPGNEAVKTEAAELQRLLADLRQTHYLVYSPRRAMFLRVAYELFPRPGQVALQIALMRRLIHLCPDAAAPRVQLAQMLADHERLLADSGQREIEAQAERRLAEQREKLCREALALDPKNWEALVLLGRLDEAIALRPRDPRLRRLRIEHAHQTGETGNLIDDARRLVSLTADDEARYILALAHVMTGDVTPGLRELAALLRRSEAKARGGALPEDYTRWAVNYAILCSRVGRFAEARAALERAAACGGLDGTAPIEANALRALLHLAAGDRERAREMVGLLPEGRPRGALIPVVADLTIRTNPDPQLLRRVNVPPAATGFTVQFLAWEEYGVSFDLEPIARRILQRDPESLAGRFLLADALASRVPPLLGGGEPDPRAREAMALLHGLIRDYPGWVPPIDCLGSLCVQMGEIDRASMYQRLAGELYSDQDRSRWFWRSTISGLRPGLPGYMR